MRLRVLVADGNKDSADSLSLLLDLWGYDPHVAYAGSSALELARCLAPQFVLTDIALPGLDGLELARQLRGQTTLIAVTGLGLERYRRLSREAGFQHFLIKPVEPEELRALLAREARRQGLRPKLPIYPCCGLSAGAV